MALSDQELIALLTDLEPDRVERKENAANSDRLSEAICAFANDMPGYGEPGVLFVGVSDNGAVLDRPVTDDCCGAWPTSGTRAPSCHHRLAGPHHVDCAISGPRSATGQTVGASGSVNAVIAAGLFRLEAWRRWDMSCSAMGCG